MTNDLRTSGGHSAEYFGDSRDHWWNPDFLRLLAARWDVRDVRTALDVGCGLGHWSRCLASILPDEAIIDGVDADPRWVEELSRRAHTHGGRGRVSLGRAEALTNTADDSYDLVTCQTVLIHVRDPEAALREMIRVTRPGGLVIAAEPNNLAAVMTGDSASWDAPVEQRLATVRLQMICERGKAAAGLGDNSVGERVPGFFAAAGLERVQVFMNDRAAPVIPPYADPAARAAVNELTDWAARGFWIWNAEETRRYYDAGGGPPEDFASLWAAAMDERQRQARAIAAGTYQGGGGGLLYVVSGRKPRR